MPDLDLSRRLHRLPRLSVVMPAFNEAENLAETLQGLVRVLDGLHLPWEVIVVDDGSADDTSRVLQSWLAEPGVRCLRLSRNFGK